jgi:hypothetical protein
MIQRFDHDIIIVYFNNSADQLMKDIIHGSLIRCTSIFNPNVTTIHSNRPIWPGHLKAVFDISSIAINIWFYPALPSIKLITLCPAAASTNKSATGIGYPSIGVALFKYLKSMQTLIFPFFL